MLTLEDIFSPQTFEQFTAESFTKAPALLEGKRERFSHLLTPTQLIEIITSRPLPSNHIGLSLNGQSIPIESFCRQSPNTDTVIADLPRLTEALEAGATLFVAHFETLHQDLWDCCALLSEAFQVQVTVNAYFGGPGSRGFAPHIDHHDVLVAQAWGSKSWMIGDPTTEAPLVLPDHMSEPAGELTRSLELRSGDLLYLPRGYWHAAKGNESEGTLHLSFGIQPSTGIHFLGWLRRELLNERAFRLELPRFEDSSVLREHLRTLSHELGEVLNEAMLTKYLESHQVRIRAERAQRAEELWPPR